MTRVVSIPFAAPTALATKPPASVATRSPKAREFFAGTENYWLPTVVDRFVRGQGYSPLVLCGPTGVGKSHLALGIVQAWGSRHPGDAIVCTNAADFARDYFEAHQRDTIVAWQQRIRAARLFVFEELAALATKPAAQVELLHTLDALADEQAHVIVTARQLPERTPKLLPTLASRLCGGLVVPLSLPGPETRRAVLDRAARNRRLAVTDRGLQALAEHLTVNVPELCGALLELESEAPADGRPIDVPLVESFVARRLTRRIPTLPTIARHAARYYGLTVSQLKSVSRRRGVVLARDVAMHLARQLTGKSLAEIGTYFGGRDHTTVLHGCRQIDEQVRRDATLVRSLDELRETLRHG